MQGRRLIRLAWALWGLVIASLAATAPLGLADPVGTAEQGGAWIFLVFAAFVLTFSTVGVLIAAQQPSNPIGWLLLACAVGYALAGLTNAYSSYGLNTRPGELPAVALMNVVSGVLFLVGGGPAATFLLLLFPTGRLLSRRWRAVGWLAGVGMVLVAAGMVLAPGPIGGEPGAPANPLGIPGAENLVRAAEAIGLGAFALAVFGSVASLIVRFRRAQLVERQQLKWLSYAAVLVGLAALFQIVLFAIWGETTVTSSLANGATTGSLACVPVAIGIAILRYRLYDIDASSVAPWSMCSSASSLALAMPAWSWALASCSVGSAPSRQAGQWLAPPWGSRPCFSRPGGASSRWWTGASTAAATTRPGRSRRSASACATSLTSTP
jgi:hypothetical protein